MARFDVVKRSFWSGGRYGVLPPLTDGAVNEAHALLGVTLPDELLALLRVQNGGLVSSAWNAFPVQQSTYPEGHIPLDHVAGIGHVDSPMSLLHSPRLVRESRLPPTTVLMDGDGHYWIGLDYRGCGPGGEPSVAWFDRDRDIEFTLAATFRSFVEGLTAAASMTDADCA